MRDIASVLALPLGTAASRPDSTADPLGQRLVRIDLRPRLARLGLGHTPGIDRPEPVEPCLLLSAQSAWLPFALPCPRGRLCCPCPRLSSFLQVWDLGITCEQWALG